MSCALLVPVQVLTALDFLAAGAFEGIILIVQRGESHFAIHMAFAYLTRGMSGDMSDVLIVPGLMGGMKQKSTETSMCMV